MKRGEVTKLSFVRLSFVRKSTCEERKILLCIWKCQEQILNEKNLVKNSFHDAYPRCVWGRQQIAAETAQQRKTSPLIVQYAFRESFKYGKVSMPLSPFEIP